MKNTHVRRKLMVMAQNLEVPKGRWDHERRERDQKIWSHRSLVDTTNLELLKLDTYM